MGGSGMIPLLTLNTGAKMPCVGLGIGYADNTDVKSWTLIGIKAGARLLDTAARYGTEKAVGEAVREAAVTQGISREEFFVTTKLNYTAHDPETVGPDFEASLAKLDLGYVDLWLMHAPSCIDPKTNQFLPYGSSPTFIETWKAMEKVFKSNPNKCTAIGVSNFSVKLLKMLLKEAEIVPAVNQVECHPYLPQMDLDGYCKDKGIVLTAWSPMVPKYPPPSPIFSEPIIVEVAKKYGVGIGTIIVSWMVQRGNWVTIPKSLNYSRQVENSTVIKLDQVDFDAIMSIHELPGKLRHGGEIGEEKEWEDGYVYEGWSLEDAGWIPRN